MRIIPERCNAKRPDVKPQIIRPRFSTAFISPPNLSVAFAALRRSLSFPKKGERGVGGVGVFRATHPNDPRVPLALACAAAAHVSCGNFRRYAALGGDDFGVLLADDHKK